MQLSYSILMLGDFADNLYDVSYVREIDDENEKSKLFLMAANQSAQIDRI